MPKQATYIKGLYFCHPCGNNSDRIHIIIVPTTNATTIIPIHANIVFATLFDGAVSFVCIVEADLALDAIFFVPLLISCWLLGWLSHLLLLFF